MSNQTFTELLSKKSIAGELSVRVNEYGIVQVSIDHAGFGHISTYFNQQVMTKVLEEALEKVRNFKPTMGICYECHAEIELPAPFEKDDLYLCRHLCHNCAPHGQEEN